MRKRHAPSRVNNMTLCGHETTPPEFKFMLRRQNKAVNCKRCLDAIALRELINEADFA